MFLLLSPKKMNKTNVLRNNASLMYGTMDEDEVFVDIEAIDGDISEQQLEAKRNILMNLICVSAILAILVIIVSAAPPDQTF